MSAKKKVVKLPEKPSALIRVALRDLEKAEKSPRYEIDMDVFHVPNGHCRVCFAGSVMAFTLKVAREFNSLHVGTLPENSKMLALDAARCGFVDSMFNHLDKQKPGDVPDAVGVTPYTDSPKLFKRDMRKLATLLAKHGA